VRRKNLSLLPIALVACGLLAASAAQAGVVGVKLEPMNPRIPVDGIARMMTRGHAQMLDLRVFTGTLRDGTVLLVSVVRADGRERIEAAKIEVVLGSALLRLDIRKDVSPVFPFAGLREFYISLPGVGDLAHGTVATRDR
jgi:hypothetical protein